MRHSPGGPSRICRMGRVTRLDSQYRIGMAARPTGQTGHAHGVEHPGRDLLDFHQRHGHTHDSDNLIVRSGQGHIQQIDTDRIALRVALPMPS